MQLEELDTAVRDYIKQLEARYEQRSHELEANLKELESSLKESETNLKEYKYKYLELQERYDLLLYKRFVRSAEKILSDEKQLRLFTSEDAIEEANREESNPEELTEVKSFKRKKSGRKPIDSKIPRTERTIDIEESQKACNCGATLTKIGEETNEKLHIIPPRIFVERVIRLKYACRCCEGVDAGGERVIRIAPVEPSLIPRSIVSPSLLSCIFTQKFQDHLPYYRQEKQFERIGVSISRQDMSNWQQQAYKKLTQLFSLLKETVKSGPVIQMDETVVQVMGEEGRLDTQKSYMWLARGGPPDKKVVWYEYHETRSANHAKTFLEKYCGYLQTDGYEGYDAAVRDKPNIIHVGCFAHARRKYFEAAKATKQPHLAEEGMKHIRKLYRLESELRSQNLDDETFLRERKLKAEPILDEFKQWLIKHSEEVPPSLLLGKAIAYTLSQWDKMIKYLESPYLTPDNNACENAIRPFVLGRKNWLFCKSPAGAESSCGIYSLIETAKQNGLIPQQYLTTLFEKAPLAVSQEDWEQLLPWNINSG